MSADQTHSHAETIVHALDPSMADLVRKYLDRCTESAVQLRHLAIAGDFSGAERIGYALAGSGRSFGFPRISKIGRHVTYAAARADRAQLLALVQRLQRYLDAVTPAPLDDPSP